jgi:hypothetical protein
MAAGVRRRQAMKLSATPAWANSFFIVEAYRLAKLRTEVTGIKWEVDHIIPLRHPLVCGLHVEHNLRVIPMAQNRRKGNKLLVPGEFTPERAPDFGKAVGQ